MRGSISVGDGTCRRATDHVVELRTDRLLLRQWRPEDREPFAGLTSDPEVMLHFPSPLSRQESDGFADRLEEAIAQRGWGMWALEETATGSFVGFTGIVWPPRYADAPFMQIPEIGWRLVRAAWGRGYAGEAAHASARFAFGELGVGEIFAMATFANARSRAVMERIGMRRDPANDLDSPLADADGARRYVLYRLTPEQLIEPARRGRRAPAPERHRLRPGA